MHLMEGGGGGGGIVYHCSDFFLGTRDFDGGVDFDHFGGLTMLSCSRGRGLWSLWLSGRLVVEGLLMMRMSRADMDGWKCRSCRTSKSFICYLWGTHTSIGLYHHPCLCVVCNKDGSRSEIHVVPAAHSLFKPP